MKKKTRKLDYPQRYLLIVAVVQLILVIVFFWAYIGTQSVPADQLHQKTITVENPLYTRGYGSSFHIYLYDPYEHYRFPNVGSISNSELNRIISKGDLLTVTYEENITLLGEKIHWIAAAEMDGKPLRTLEEYYRRNEENRKVTLVVFGVIEVLFLAVSALGTLFDGRWREFRKRLLRHRRKKKEIGNEHL
ncbi:MAG: hypothetical protein IJE00_01695 [Clostridia bacterium]|nr:hypothetical protein [Clostridia bacterium]